MSEADAPGQREIYIPMRLRIGLSGGGEASLTANLNTVQQLNEIMQVAEDRDREVERRAMILADGGRLDSPEDREPLGNPTHTIVLSNDPGDRPYFFRAPRSMVTWIHAEITDGGGFCLLSPETTREVVELLTILAEDDQPDASGSSDDRARAAGLARKIREGAGLAAKGA